MPVKRYDAVIFDLDDTLTKTWRAKWDQLKAIGREQYGIKLTDHDLQAHSDKPLEEKLRLLFNDKQTPYNKLLTLLKRYNARFPRTLQDDTLLTMQWLKQAGLALGIVSGGHGEFVAQDLVRLGFPEMTLGVHCHNTSRLRKPQPEVFDEILQTAQAQGLHDRSRMVYVGDSLDDYYAARAAGLDFIGITTGQVTATGFKNACVRHMFSQLLDVVSPVTGLPVKVGGILLQDNHVLVVRNKGERHFIAPGGSVEQGETISAALTRELQEELSIRVPSDGLEPFGAFNNHRAYMSVWQVTKWKGTVTATNEVEELRWVDSSNAHLLLPDSIFATCVLPQLYAAQSKARQ